MVSALSKPIGRIRRVPGIRDALSMMAAASGHVLLRRAPAEGTGFVSSETPFIITGMHRSGTSLVARLLERGGMYIGGSWLDQNDEALHFSRANRAMLGEGPYALRDYGWTAPKTAEFIRIRRGYAERAAANTSAFFADFREERVWGWKDPRTCLTLPVWLKIYPSARVLHVVRDGRAVALSLTDRDDLHPAFGLGLWEYYVTRVEEALETMPNSHHHTVRFEDVTQAPAETLPKLYEFAQLEQPAGLDAIVADVDAKRATARLSDPRIAGMGDHPLLGQYGYR